jgi:hypothetical protein
MRKTRLQHILNKLESNDIVEVPSVDLVKDHRGFDKILRTFGLKKDITIAEDKDRSTIIFKRKT